MANGYRREYNNDDRPNTAPVGRDKKSNLLLRVRISKISLFCTKVGKGLCRSLSVEADFLSSATNSSAWLLG